MEPHVRWMKDLDSEANVVTDTPISAKGNTRNSLRHASVSLSPTLLFRLAVGSLSL